jgi:hypothetical protein
MRVFFTTTIALAKEFMASGFRNLYRETFDVPLSDGATEIRGVWMADKPLDINEGFEGPVVLCLDVPDETFRKFEWQEKDLGYRHALIHSPTLNAIGKPTVYDLHFAGDSRRDLLNAICCSQEQASVENNDVCAAHLTSHADKLREAKEFLDEIGWLTPIRFREEVASYRPNDGR